MIGLVVMNTYIYARVSTVTQNLESQVDYLCEKNEVSKDNLFAEKERVNH